MKRVRKAIFPVAGLGTRMLPAAKTVAKEMLPVVDRPLIHHVISEARAAGIEQAKLFVVAIDAKEQSVRAVEYVKQRHPHVFVIARAFDRVHYYELRQAGADMVIRELFGSSLQAAEQALVVLGVDPAIAARSTAVFRQHDEETVEELYTFWKKDEDLMENPSYIAKAKQRVQMFNDALELDREAAEENKHGTNS
jgi:voltage-gated potassium channel Kch